MDSSVTEQHPAIPILKDEIERRMRHITYLNEQLARYFERIKEDMDKTLQYPSSESAPSSILTQMDGIRRELEQTSVERGEIRALEYAVRVLERAPKENDDD